MHSPVIPFTTFLNMIYVPVLLTTTRKRSCPRSLKFMFLSSMPAAVLPHTAVHDTYRQYIQFKGNTATHLYTSTDMLSHLADSKADSHPTISSLYQTYSAPFLTDHMPHPSNLRLQIRLQLLPLDTSPPTCLPTNRHHRHPLPDPHFPAGSLHRSNFIRIVRQ